MRNNGIDLKLPRWVALMDEVFNACMRAQDDPSSTPRKGYVVTPRDVAVGADVITGLCMAGPEFLIRLDQSQMIATHDAFTTMWVGDYHHYFGGAQDDRRAFARLGELGQQLVTLVHPLHPAHDYAVNQAHHFQPQGQLWLPEAR
jgi:hypothetical protein